MAGGLAALLDDVAMIAKMASAASGKAAAVVVDDTAVTPQYVQGFSPARELPIIGKIALGSLRNKAIIIVAIMAMSQFAPFLLTPLLMLGGAYLCYEGAEKFWEAATGHREHDGVEDPDAGTPALERGREYEDDMVKGAITTDFILSAEIMVISLNQIADAAFVPRLITLIVVALAMTVLVYGFVGLLVKLDDIGLHLQKSGNGASRGLGAALVAAMPRIMDALSTIGMIAMLWVGGHILIDGANKLGWHSPMDLLHHLEEPAAHVHGFLGWLVDTLLSALVGLAVGAVIVGLMHVLPLPKRHHGADAQDAHGAAEPTVTHPARAETTVVREEDLGAPRQSATGPGSPDGPGSHRAGD